VSTAGALTAIDDILSRGGEADDVLRHVVGALVADGGCAWAAILFNDAGELMLGPQAGEAQPDRRLQVPVAWQGTRVAELAADGCDDRELLERAAPLVASYCLVGWDTGGVPWEEVS
jgi:hypothetical protein